MFNVTAQEPANGSINRLPLGRSDLILLIKRNLFPAHLRKGFKTSCSVYTQIYQSHLYNTMPDVIKKRNEGQFSDKIRHLLAENDAAIADYPSLVNSN